LSVFNADAAVFRMSRKIWWLYG